MSKYTYNEFHLGDNLIHLNFLRKLAAVHPDHVFIHAVHECHRAQLEEVVEDLENIMLIPLEQRERYAPASAWINAWKDEPHGAPSGFWFRHPHRNDWVTFHLQWFAYLAHRMGYPCPVNEPKDLLFDWPGLGHFHSPRTERFLIQFADFHQHFDFLIVNSRPCSGQLLAYDSLDYLTPLIEELHAKYRIVVTQPVLRHSAQVINRDVIPCTMDYGLSLTDIGSLSLCAKHLLMVSTGPSWPTFNLWNQESVQTRILLLEKETVELAGAINVRSREEARRVLVEKGLL